jgi:hypothetical protein
LFGFSNFLFFPSYRHGDNRHEHHSIE